MSRLTGSAVPPWRQLPGQQADADLVDGDLLAGRYRLLSRVDAAPPGHGRPASLWLARDELLTRPVAVKALACEPGPDGGSASRFLAAARAAGAVGSPVLARVYDASLEQRYHGPEQVLEPGADVAYVIREWVDGLPLAEALERDGPLDPLDAVALTAAVAQALTAAHARGLAHGRLHPGNVLLCRGAVRVTDLAVSAALPGGGAPAARAEDGDAVADDVRDLAAVLYAMLTGRWPVSATPQPAGGVPAAPVGPHRSGARGRLTGPRAVRGLVVPGTRGVVVPGTRNVVVPRALDAVVARALDPARARACPPLTSAQSLVDALQDAVALPDGRGQERRTRRPRLSALGALALLGALGSAAFAAGSTVGSAGTQARAGAAPATGDGEVGGPGAGDGTPSTGRTSEPDGQPAGLLPREVADFDPQGDGAERPATVAAAVDGDPSTAWTTERYETAAFGGLKEGVGLLLDLGAPTSVTALELAVSRPGVSVELRGAATRGAEASSYRVLAHGRAEGGRLVLAPPEGTRERYYLVWVTHLVADGDRFTAGVDELLLRGDGAPDTGGAGARADGPGGGADGRGPGG